MEPFQIIIKGQEYTITPYLKDGIIVYKAQVGEHEVSFEKNNEGKLSASHDHIPNEFLSELAQKIESYFF
ncbi:hypothetical protein DVR12_24585 [Chitinophaga silvatica]|uniref:Uncharacterized protein n=1 Tax=Chitinophaga silvatica TaxID=2282649 RepID=A0A3E1Y3C5_9BACT|nr:hypothetical protein [Chitinophaga silvatica]RFS19154.1 hypothetical protein DVR12_24585 [Chitinophaga silvatica]